MRPHRGRAILLSMAAIELIADPLPLDRRRDYLACEIYQAWQAAFDDAQEAFLAWSAAPYGRKHEAYTVYRAACDREDAAADRWLVV